MKLLEIKNGFFNYGEKNIFKDVDLVLNKGEVICLIGPNGCGKTTLLDCILGINNLKSGDIFLKGHNISLLKPFEIAREISYVPQCHKITFPYKVIEVVLMGRASYVSVFSSPKEKDLCIAREALNLLKIGHLEDCIYTQLSGGQMQMVMIARAIAQKTSIIVMDEPTSHLDFKNEFNILDIISDLVIKTNISVIMATHSPNHSFYLANSNVKTKVAINYNNKIEVVDSIKKALTEENIKRIFNMDAKILTYDLEDLKNLNYIVPINKKGELKNVANK